MPKLSSSLRSRRAAVQQKQQLRRQCQSLASLGSCGGDGSASPMNPATMALAAAAAGRNGDGLCRTGRVVSFDDTAALGYYGGCSSRSLSSALASSSPLDRFPQESYLTPPADSCGEPSQPPALKAAPLQLTVTGDDDEEQGEGGAKPSGGSSLLRSRSRGQSKNLASLLRHSSSLSEDGEAATTDEDESDEDGDDEMLQRPQHRRRDDDCWGQFVDVIPTDEQYCGMKGGFLVSPLSAHSPYNNYSPSPRMSSPRSGNVAAHPYALPMMQATAAAAATNAGLPRRNLNLGRVMSQFRKMSSCPPTMEHGSPHSSSSSSNDDDVVVNGGFASSQLSLLSHGSSSLEDDGTGGYFLALPGTGGGSLLSPPSSPNNGGGGGSNPFTNESRTVSVDSPGGGSLLFRPTATMTLKEEEEAGRASPSLERQLLSMHV